MAVTFQYTKLRRTFGRQPLFCEAGPMMCDNIPVNLAERKAYILRNPVHQPVQHTPIYSRQSINTFRAEFVTTGTNHAEGGWPKDVQVHDIEHTQRYRRKIEKEDNYIQCVMGIAPAMEHYILQNNGINMYQTYYSELEGMGPVERTGCRTVNVYRDPCSPPRPISAISWQHDGGHRFTVAYNDVDFNRLPQHGTKLKSFVWDVENSTFPIVALQTPCALIDLQYNNRDINMLVGGLIDGRVGIWDQRTGGDPKVTCAPHVAHRDLVRSAIFINAKSGQEFFSGSADGCIKWWDVRNLSEFTEEMILDVVKASFDVQSMAKSCGVCSLEFEPTIPTRFMVGTENGYMIGGNRKGKTPMEKLPYKFPAHLGPIWAVERNPGFLKNFLTIGDWTARIWSEDCRESAVLWSPPHRHRVTSGAWSPTRLSLMLLTQWDGVLALWDVMRRQHEPVLAVHVCEEPLLRVRPHEQGTIVACGSDKGNVYMQELSPSLSVSDPKDKVLMTLMLERESKRERILEARLREIRLKQRQAEEGGAEAGDDDPSIEAAIGDKDLHEAVNTYMAQVKREIAAI